MKTFVYLLLAVSIAAPVSQAKSLSENPQIREAATLLQLWLEAQRDYKQLPGVTFAVLHDQEILVNGGYGYANPAKKLPATGDTIHSICSISKLFTGVAAMRLVDQGKLRLDDPVTRYLPWFKMKNTFPEAGNATLLNLLTHSSGLPGEPRISYWSTPSFPTVDMLKDATADQKTMYPADTYFNYSNLGLSLVGAVVASAAGEPYENYINATILKPLGMKDTRPTMPKSLHGKQLAIGHSVKQRDGEQYALPYFNARDVGPAAGFSSSANDLAKFAAWQFRLLNEGGEEILQSNTLRKMQRVNWLDEDWSHARGIGFDVWQDDNEKFVGHGGHCPGYTTKLLLQPKDRIATIVMSNASGVDSGDYAQQAYKVIAPAIKTALAEAENGDQPSASKEIKAELKQYLGIYNMWPFAADTAIVAWEGGLASVRLPTDKPMDSLVKLKHIEGNVFRELKKDGALGGRIEFEKNARGEVTHLLSNESYVAKKVRNIK